MAGPENHDYAAIGTGVAGFFAALGMWWNKRKSVTVERRANDTGTRKALEAIGRQIEKQAEQTEKHFDKLEANIGEQVVSLHRRIDAVAEKTDTLSGYVRGMESRL